MYISLYRKIAFTLFTFLIFTGLFCSPTTLPYVTDLRVEDAPDDDGDGLIIRFSPLPAEHHILEYRIYRGITPDTLFYIAKIEVDPKSVNTDADIIFLDKDWRPFVDVESPGRLHRERGQKPGSPIYGELPRDVSVVAPLLDKFSTLAIIGNHNFYNKSQKIITDTNGEKQLYAGLRIEDFETIVAKHKPNTKYYYSVIPVNHTRTYLPHCPPVLGVPYDNLPLATEHFYPVYLSDTQTLNIEFELQGYISNIYMIHQSQLPALEAYKSYMQDLEEFNRLTALGIATLAIPPEPPAEVENPGQQIAQVLGSKIVPYGKNFCSLKYEDGNLISDLDESLIPFNPDQLDAYLFYIAIFDFTKESISTPIPATSAESSALPTLPDFVVRNKPNSKGDTQEVIIGKPYAMLTHFNFRSRGTNRRKLSVAYTYTESPLYKIKNITFDFLNADGSVFLKHTEHFIDNVFNITLPSDRFEKDGFSVRITLNTAKNTFNPIAYDHTLAPPPTSENHSLLQDLMAMPLPKNAVQTRLFQTVNYEEELMSYKPSNLYIDGEDSKYYKFMLLRKARSMEEYAIVGASTALLVASDDIVSFEEVTYKTIASYDLHKKILLVDSEVELYDDDLAKGEYFTTSIFLEEYKEILKNKITALSVGTPFMVSDESDGNDGNRPEDQSPMSEELQYYQSLLDAQTTHPLAIDINNPSFSRAKRAEKIIAALDFTNRHNAYSLLKTDERGLFTLSDPALTHTGEPYFYPKPTWFNSKTVAMLISSLLFGIFVFYFYFATKKGRHSYIRPIAGLEEVDNAIGRATEMGNPILFVPGFTSIDDVATLAGLSILGHITKKAAEYDTRIIVPIGDYIVLPIAQQIVKESFFAAGRPDSFNINDVFFVAEDQFAFVAGVNGVMIRQKTAANFYLGMFFAESLIMTETGNNTGAIQIAGTDAVTQLPFFITTCDYTLIGEEFYAASAYLSKDPVIIGTLKSQDVTKLLIIVFVVIGTILSSFHINTIIDWFPTE